jgi:leucyl-tRNA---protein transferase
MKAPTSELHVLFEANSPPALCPYLPRETASLRYRIITSLSAGEYQELLRRGWRRHGCSFFRPDCPQCVECRSLRVDVSRFRPTKSQRRCLRRNAGVRVVVRRPTVTAEHLWLFNAYHADMHRRRGWPHRAVDADEYQESFLSGAWSFAREFLYHRDGRLAGVGLVDAAPEGLSSVYFYHDPAWRPLGPGTFTNLKEIEHARPTGRRYHYLGYWIAGCPSMSYKNRFGPHEILARYPGDDEEPEWRPVEGDH